MRAALILAGKTIRKLTAGRRTKQVEKLLAILRRTLRQARQARKS